MDGALPESLCTRMICCENDIRPMPGMKTGIAREALSCECGTQFVWNYTETYVYRQGISWDL
jgi:hypothetical protein